MYFMLLLRQYRCIGIKISISIRSFDHKLNDSLNEQISNLSLLS